MAVKSWGLAPSNPDVSFLWAQLRDERDHRLAQTDWVVARHRDQIDMSAETTLTLDQYADLLAYRQALRDIPITTADPTDPAWPEPPSAVQA